MQTRPKISQKAKANASLAYAEHRFRFGVENPLKAKWNALVAKSTGRSYDAATTAEQTRKRFKKNIKEKKQALAQAIRRNEKDTVSLPKLRAILKTVGNKEAQAQIENIGALEKELQSTLKGTRELKRLMTAVDLASSDKKTRDRFFRMKKLKKARQKR
jgi:hypothetical protein